jgi:hypothetical protein
MRRSLRLGAPPIAPTVEELAWIAAPPCALLTLAAVLALGPALGHLLLAPGSERLWPPEASWLFGRPEAAKHGRYLVALLGPVLLCAVVLWGARRPQRIRLRPALLRGVVVASQLLLVAGVAVAIAAQRRVVYGGFPPAWRIFTLRALLAACALGGILALTPRLPAAWRVAARLRPDTRARTAACSLAATAATVVWLLPGVTTDASIANGPWPDLPPWAMGDANAILDGRTPLADFHPLYGHLWAYVGALAMGRFGATITVFSLTMTIVSAAALLAAYGLLRRVVRSATAALALYLPFLATSLFVVGSPLGWRMSNAGIYSVWPMRYAGPLVLAWLTARQLDGARPRRPWALLLVAGLVAINNLEFGLGALAATLVALACDPMWRSRAAAGRLALSAVGGVLGAASVVALVTLLRAGSLPRFGLLLEFPRLFGVSGLASLPMATVGFHLAIYATLAAALATAAVRVTRGAGDVLLTGMLAWSGVFGLAAGSYFVGRSDPLKLAAILPAWALSLSLLLVVVVRALSARAWRRPAPAELLVLFGFGLAVSSLAQLPAPWTELRRLRPAGVGRVYEQPDARRLIAQTTRRGEHVAILLPMGDLMAHELQLVDVSPYALVEEIATRRQMRVLLRAMHIGHAHKLYVAADRIAARQRRALERAGLSERALRAPYSYWADESAARSLPAES